MKISLLKISRKKMVINRLELKENRGFIEVE